MLAQTWGSAPIPIRAEQRKRRAMSLVCIGEPEEWGRPRTRPFTFRARSAPKYLNRNACRPGGV